MEERVQEEINICAYLLKDVLDEEVGMTKVIKLGKHNENNINPTPILIKLKSESEIWHVLTKTKTSSLQTNKQER